MCMIGSILLLLIGIGIIICGSLLIIDINEMVEEATRGDIYPRHVYTDTGAAFLFIIFGVWVFIIVSCLGLCGVLKDFEWMVGLYAYLLILIFVGQVAIIIASCVMVGKVEGEINKAMSKLLVEASGDKKETMELWDNMQKEFNCCGVSHSSDWRKNNTYFKPNVPKSCCKDPEDTRTCTDAWMGSKNGVWMGSEFNNLGCLGFIEIRVRVYTFLLAFAGAVFAVPQIGGIIIFNINSSDYG